MMDSGKDPISGNRCDPRVSGSLGDIHANLSAFFVVPFDRETVGDVLCCQTQRRRKMSWSETSEPNEARTADCPLRHQLWPERGWEVSHGYIGIDSVVDKQSSLDCAIDRVGQHLRFLSLKR